MDEQVTWPAIFAASLIADIVTTVLASRRGMIDGNPLLRLRNPIVVMVSLSALIVAPAEVCRALGAVGVDLIYAGGTAPHAIAAVVNAVQLWGNR